MKVGHIVIYCRDKKDNYCCKAIMLAWLTSPLLLVCKSWWRYIECLIIYSLVKQYVNKLMKYVPDASIMKSTTHYSKHACWKVNKAMHTVATPILSITKDLWLRTFKLKISSVCRLVIGGVCKNPQPCNKYFTLYCVHRLWDKIVAALQSNMW